MPNVLIVEDNVMMADILESTLLGAGYQVGGVARSVEQAVCLGRERRCDLGILDLRLADGGLGTEVAVLLRRQQMFGVLYATGNPDHPALQGAAGEGCIAKPYRASSLLSALRIVEQVMCGVAVTLRAPHGFRLLG